MVSSAYSSLVSLKTQWEFKVQMEKREMAQIVSYWNQPRSKIKESHWGKLLGPLDLFLWLAMCYRESLPCKGCLCNRNLRQALALPKERKKKKNCQGFYYNPPCDARGSKSMMRTLTSWVANKLKVRGRAHYNPESTYQSRIIVTNPLITAELRVWNPVCNHCPK